MEADQPAAAFDYFLTVPYYQFATVERMITDVLDLDDTRYEPPTGRQGHRTDRPVLGRDGTLRRRGHAVELARAGLPTMDTIELPAGRAEREQWPVPPDRQLAGAPPDPGTAPGCGDPRRAGRGVAIRRDGEAADQR